MTAYCFFRKLCYLQKHVCKSNFFSVAAVFVTAKLTAFEPTIARLKIRCFVHYGA